MPHIIVEHSSDISSSSVNNFLSEIQKILVSVHEGNFALEGCKSRAISFSEYFVGTSNEKNSSFLHITIKILAGRSVEIKKSVAAKVAQFAQEFLRDQHLKTRIELSVDIVDMNKDAYTVFKF